MKIPKITIKPDGYKNRLSQYLSKHLLYNKVKQSKSKGLDLHPSYEKYGSKEFAKTLGEVDISDTQHVQFPAVLLSHYREKNQCSSPCYFYPIDNKSMTEMEYFLLWSTFNHLHYTGTDYTNRLIAESIQYIRKEHQELAVPFVEQLWEHNWIFEENVGFQLLALAMGIEQQKDIENLDNDSLFDYFDEIESALNKLKSDSKNMNEWMWGLHILKPHIDLFIQLTRGKSDDEIKKINRIVSEFGADIAEFRAAISRREIIDDYNPVQHYLFEESCPKWESVDINRLKEKINFEIFYRTHLPEFVGINALDWFQKGDYEKIDSLNNVDSDLLSLISSVTLGLSESDKKKAEEMSSGLGNPESENFFALNMTKVEFFNQNEAYDESENLLIKLIEHLSKKEEDLPQLNTARFKLTEVYRLMGDKKQLLAAYEDLISLRETLFGETHQQTISTYFLAGNEYYLQGDMEKAEFYFLKALKAEDYDDMTMVVIMKASLGSIFALKEENEKAEKFLTEALVLSKKEFGKEYFTTEKCTDDLASFYFGQKNYGKCRDLNEELLLIKMKNCGPKDVSTISTLIHLAMAHNMLGDHSKAKDVMNEIIKVYQEVHEQLDKSTNNVFLQLFNFYDQKQKERIEQSKKFVQDRKKTKSLMKEAKQYENDNDIEKAIKSYLQAADLSFAIFESGGPADPDSLLTAGLRLYELELPEYAELCMNKLLTMMNTFDKVDEKLKLMVHKVLDLIHSTKQKTDKNT
ncbi:MAG: tetratricopeptide repeat protein [Candidatus Aminicenantes bacterium]|nr:tetratricopeptide repeat protein [Candidatus Aminicenantes bacterium]